jgi:hypothetical protein
MVPKRDGQLLAAAKIPAMIASIPRTQHWTAVLALVAIIFGVITTIAGGGILFGGLAVLLLSGRHVF